MSWLLAKVAERYDVYRDKITQLTSKELMDALLIKLIESLTRWFRNEKSHLIKTAATIEATSNKLINTLLSLQKWRCVTQLWFFDQKVLKTPNRVNVVSQCHFTDELAKEFTTTIENVQAGKGLEEQQNLIRLFSELTKACLQHFLVDFTKTLNLNMLKRAAIPVTDGIIVKVIDIALRRFNPANARRIGERFTKHYQALIFNGIRVLLTVIQLDKTALQ